MSENALGLGETAILAGAFGLGSYYKKFPVPGQPSGLSPRNVFVSLCYLLPISL
jgi:hypothetical protein